MKKTLPNILQLNDKKKNARKTHVLITPAVVVVQFYFTLFTFPGPGCDTISMSLCQDYFQP